jgi:hypothetical protein
LRSLYRHVDDIEFYAGLFAEDTREHSAVGPMIGRLVGGDAFSQALTNPLRSQNVYNSGTFSRAGWTIIHETKSLAEIVRRNLPAGRPPFRVSLTREGAKVEYVGPASFRRPHGAQGLAAGSTSIATRTLVPDRLATSAIVPTNRPNELSASP